MFKSGVKAPNDWVVSWPGRFARSPSTTTGSAQCCKLCKTKNRGGLAGGKQRGKQGRKQGRETNEVARTHGTRPRRPPSNSRALYCNRAPQVSSQRQPIPFGAGNGMRWARSRSEPCANCLASASCARSHCFRLFRIPWKAQ